MIYIKLAEKEKNTNIEVNYSNIFWKIIDNIKNKFTKLKEEKFEDKVLITIPDVEDKTLKKLSDYIKQKCVYRVCLSNELLVNKVFVEFIQKQNVKVFTGRWLFRHLLPKCVEYIATCKREKIEYQEVSILTKNINELVVYNIRELSGKVKIINIITENENTFRKLEKELYEQKGIILNMNNNYKKSLIKSDIILNFDFLEDEVNQYTLPKKACIINLERNINLDSKAFEGINACFYEISMPRKYIKNLIYFRNFSTQILYESFVYKNTDPNNIKNELDADGISINFLNGKNGKIRKTEYLNLSKKIVN